MSKNIFQIDIYMYSIVSIQEAKNEEKQQNYESIYMQTKMTQKGHNSI
jgi:hypothetical protein